MPGLDAPSDGPDPRLESRARTLSGGSVGLSQAWLHALGRLDSIPADAGDLDWLATAAGGPARTLQLATWLAHDPSAGPALAGLRSAASGSPWPPGDWIDAALLVADWAAARSRPAPAASVTGYLTCTAELLARDPRGTLAAAVRRMLDDHGFLGG